MSNIIPFLQKLIKGGGIRAGGLENCSKINKWGDDYSVLESTILLLSLYASTCSEKHPIIRDLSSRGIKSRK